MFPFNAGKNAFKAKNGSKSSERFIQSIYYERLSAARATGGREGGAVTITPEGRAANKSHPLPGRGDKRAERCRFGTQVGRYLQPPNTKLSRNIITSTCASLEMQTASFLHRLTAHTELVISSQVFLQQEENR